MGRYFLRLFQIVYSFNPHDDPTNYNFLYFTDGEIETQRG